MYLMSWSRNRSCHSAAEQIKTSCHSNSFSQSCRRSALGIFCDAHKLPPLVMIPTCTISKWTWLLTHYKELHILCHRHPLQLITSINPCLTVLFHNAYYHYYLVSLYCGCPGRQTWSRLALLWASFYFIFARGQFRTKINLQITRHLTLEFSTTVTAKLWPYTIMRPTLPLPRMVTADLVLSACSAA